MHPVNNQLIMHFIIVLIVHRIYLNEEKQSPWVLIWYSIEFLERKKKSIYSIFSKGLSVGKRSAGVPSAIGRHNLNDEELVNNNYCSFFY